ncbi:MAG: hypothetical protein KF819_31225 [Labilithrix sp.]|nr:hypothetical protein [Labilithrix sp.]
MVLRRFGILFAMVAIALTGCSWRHAPGHDQRAAMRQTALSAVPLRACRSGACDLVAPGGELQVSNVEVSAINSQRNETAFEMTYRGSKAVCRGPTVGPEGAEVPFACAIDGPSSPSTTSSAARHVLVMQRGCVRGTLREIAPSGELRRLELKTDEVYTAGYRSPGREVSLSDQHGVLALADAPNSFDRVLYTRRESALAAPELLALMSVQAFNGLDGHPPECLVAGN